MVISIHAPPRGATAIIVEPCQRRIFQFTPLREGRLAVGEVAACQRANFNSRPSARGDPCPAAVQPDGIISIHAPPRGATGFVLRAARRLAISIHAPPRGATQQVAHVQHNAQFQFTPLREGRQAFKSNREGNNIFQFTPLREGRRRRHDLRGRRDLISIHAPPRGATLAGGREKRRFIISIHAPPRGATRKKWYLKLTDDFNSRPSARGDEKQRRTRAATTTHFNSRPSARGDRKGLQPRRHKRISIHAPPRGATPAPSADQHHQLFQFTPLREGRRCDYAIYGRRVNFNSRPSARGDP